MIQLLRADKLAFADKFTLPVVLSMPILATAASRFPVMFTVLAVIQLLRADKLAFADKFTGSKNTTLPVLSKNLAAILSTVVPPLCMITSLAAVSVPSVRLPEFTYT